MDYKKISELLEKYWEGETSLEEEDLLRTFFSEAHPDMPEQLQEAAPLFQYFREESEAAYELPERLLTASLTQEPPSRVVTLSPYRHWMKYAAILLVAVGMGYAMKQQQRREQTISLAAAQKARVDAEAQQAFIETKKALQLLAKNLNKGTDQMQKLAYFNDATEKIEGAN